MRIVQFGMVALLLASAAYAEDLPTFRLEVVAHGIHEPVYVASDGTQRLFVVEQQGTIRLLADGGAKKPALLDIRKKVFNQSECGLLSVAFHPRFAQTGYLYVDYDERIGGKIRTVIAEFRAEPNADTVDANTERRLLVIDQPFPNHKGGQLQFGPDRMLYIAMGDGGAHDDPYGNGQNTNVLLAKLLRIDVNERSFYAVPKDNPLVGQANVKAEIWAYGLRNPWRFSFDRKTGALYAGDVGQNNYEEVDVIVKGGNYGWRPREGLHPNPNLHPSEKVEGSIDPIAEYTHSQGNNCITGGYVYRGEAIPALQGWYLYADFSSGRIWGLRWEGGKVVTSSVLLLKQDVNPSSFGEDAKGELYICDYGHGNVWKIVGK